MKGRQYENFTSTDEVVFFLLFILSQLRAESPASSFPDDSHFIKRVGFWASEREVQSSSSYGE